MAVTLPSTYTRLQPGDTITIDPGTGGSGWLLVMVNGIRYYYADMYAIDDDAYDALADSLAATAVKVRQWKQDRKEEADK